MSEVHYALILGLDGDGAALAAEAVQAAGFTLLNHSLSITSKNITLLATPSITKKLIKEFSPSQVVCICNFSGETEWTQVQKLKPIMVLPTPGLKPDWRETYLQNLALLLTSGKTRSDLLLQSAYTFAVSAHRQSGEALKDGGAEKKLMMAQQEMQAFAYSVSHDLRAPLRAVYGFSKILVDDFAEVFPEEARTFVDHIMANAQQMSSLLDDLLAFYRLGKNPPRKTEWNPTATARLVADELKQSRKEREVRFVIDDLPPVVVDPVMMEAAFRQLLDNAFKFTAPAPSPEVRLTGSKCSEGVQFIIQDNGVGFDMAHAGKLFQVFQRMHTINEFPGNGIGLAMVKKVADLHDGKVWLESVPEKGTTVYFTIPVEG